VGPSQGTFSVSPGRLTLEYSEREGTLLLKGPSIKTQLLTKNRKEGPYKVRGDPEIKGLCFCMGGKEAIH